MVQQPLLGQGLLIFEVSRSHSDTSHSVVHLPMQQPLTDNSQHSQSTSMTPTGFETAVPISERPQTHVLYRATFRMGTWSFLVAIIMPNDLVCNFVFLREDMQMHVSVG
jgi:hypothetical protein